jgi:hypothetical protein
LAPSPPSSPAASLADPKAVSDQRFKQWHVEQMGPWHLERSKHEFALDPAAEAMLSEGGRGSFYFCVRSTRRAQARAAAKAAAAAAAAQAGAAAGSDVVDHIVERLWAAKGVKAPSSPEPNHPQEQQQQQQDREFTGQEQHTLSPGRRSQRKQHSSQPRRIQSPGQLREPSQTPLQQQQLAARADPPATPAPIVQLAAQPAALQTRRQLQQQLCSPGGQAAQLPVASSLQECLQDAPAKLLPLPDQLEQPQRHKQQDSDQADSRLRPNNSGRYSKISSGGSASSQRLSSS